MGRTSQATQKKRNRERQKQERRQEKVAEKAFRKEMKKAEPGDGPVSDVDPDIAGIVPGPQPPMEF